MIVSINQPAYLPWLGYFDRIRKSDLHIVLDHVQFEKGSYTNRCRIKQRDGREMWLTVPVEKGKPINETRVIGGQHWQRKHKESMRQAYGSERWVPYGLYDRLLPALMHGFHHIMLFGLGLKVSEYPNLSLYSDSDQALYSSALGGEKLGRKSELVLNLCKETGATQYLSGPNGRDYLDIPSFEKAGIEVLYHDFPTDGDWGLSAVHHLFGPRSFEWPQVHLTSAHSSLPSAVAA